MYKIYKEPFLRIIKYFGKKKEQKFFSHPPVYIGGCARSGTTILLSILSSHNSIFTCPKELGLYNKTSKDKNGNNVPTRMDRLYRVLLTNKITKSHKMWCEKSPNNIHHIDDINNYHNGQFKFIQIVRDGRDVVLSNHPTSPDKKWVSPNRWIEDVKVGLNHIDDPRVLTIKYESLINEFHETISKICEFLNIEVSSEVLNWYQNTKVKKNKAYFGNVKPLSNKSIGKWKDPKNKQIVDKLLILPEAKELLSYHGYE